MSDYAKKKNDELAALCKERGLPHTGKKAELVKRLEDHDDATSKEPATEKAPEPASTTQGDAPAESNGKTLDLALNPANVIAGSEEVPQTEEHSAQDDQQPAETQDEVPAQDFSLGLQERTLDEEIEARKKRAEKFGLDPKQDETLKQLERAKRFGTTNLPGLLNQALPERAEKHGRKRGREAKEDNKDDRKRSRQRTDGDKKKDDKPATGKKEGDGKYPTWMTDKDREAAERRKAKYEGLNREAPSK